METESTSPAILVIIVAILALAALFTLLEYSLIKVRPTELRTMKQTRKIKRVLHMLDHLTEYLSTAQVGITLTSLILGWIGEGYITALIIKWHLLPTAVANDLSSVIGILVFTFLHAVFTDLVPKNIAIDKPVNILLAIVHPIMFFHVVFFPLVWIFDRSAAAITRLLGFSIHPDEDIYTQNEIVSLSQESEKAGELDRADVLFMERAFKMNDKVAGDIMVDRTQLTVIDVTETIDDAAHLYFEKKYTRFPVVANHDKDHILGYIFSYDIMRQNQINPEESIRAIVRRLPIAYENQPITDVLQIMIKKQVPMVIVQDEYGGTSGIVTDKDIYEELFGTIGEEIDHVQADMIEKTQPDSQGNPTFKVSGKMPLDDFMRYFKISIPQFEQTQVSTLTGFFLEQQYDLKVGQPIRVENFSFTPLDLENAYVNEFRVTVIKTKAKAKATKSAHQGKAPVPTSSGAKG
ncbi:hemolysin family protein [Limosilactobacillus fermentum]|uniref:HlyC/CorC family transporter n=1 Tax=Limosilactobacillus fermentum (strain NBRC 3956 / LMG 18251) TaxID=334390 RepID=A0ABF7R3E5_LIMF3|nr:hemolysin family protein [Limosilactobacillus fermentum]AXH07251.1 HlyC/CorC family transporter [Limosilactobacillus fermentum]MCO8300807.1 hemolysin family protein [Limosilactobacillus fermentum]MCT2874960.1 HlyC/CorC family transporter [Limosilactobacillus fermentum]MCT3451767.1 HlyC/CorC family transporter [Limosilactobacillus fermentum]MCV3755426.1 hemolysin family protein [Limosilactobacillus fermentum]